MKTKEEITRWCTDFIATTFEMPLAEVSPDAELQSFGFDSTALVSFAVELEGWLQQEVSPSALFEHPTIDALASHLAAAR